MFGSTAQSSFTGSASVAFRSNSVLRKQQYCMKIDLYCATASAASSLFGATVLSRDGQHLSRLADTFIDFTPISIDPFPDVLDEVSNSAHRWFSQEYRKFRFYLELTCGSCCHIRRYWLDSGYVVEPKAEVANSCRCPVDSAQLSSIVSFRLGLRGLHAAPRVNMGGQRALAASSETSLTTELLCTNVLMEVLVCSVPCVMGLGQEWAGRHSMVFALGPRSKYSSCVPVTLRRVAGTSEPHCLVSVKRTSHTSVFRLSPILQFSRTVTVTVAILAGKSCQPL